MLYRHYLSILLVGLFCWVFAPAAQAQCTPTFSYYTDNTGRMHLQALPPTHRVVPTGEFVWQITDRFNNTTHQRTGSQLSFVFSGTPTDGHHEIYMIYRTHPNPIPLNANHCSGGVRAWVEYNNPNTKWVQECGGATSATISYRRDPNNAAQMEFTAQSAGFSGTETYLWQIDGNLYSGPVVSIPLADGQYSALLYVTDGSCLVNEATSLYVHNGGTNCGNLAASYTYTANNDMATFTPTVTGANGAVQYDWHSGEFFSGYVETSTAMNPTFSYEPLAMGRNMRSRLTVTDANGCAVTVEEDVVLPPSNGTGNNCANGVQLEMVMHFDNQAAETSWEIGEYSNAAGLFIAYAQYNNYGASDNGTTVRHPLCLTAGCYELRVADTWGDGMCCGEGVGYYELIDQATGTVLVTGDQYGRGENIHFCIGGASDPCLDFLNAREYTTLSPNGNLALSTTIPPAAGTYYDWRITNTGTNQVVFTDYTDASSVTLPNGVYEVELDAYNNSISCQHRFTRTVTINNNNGSVGGPCGGILANMNIYQDSIDPFLLYVVPTLTNVPLGYNFQFNWQFGNQNYSGTPAYRFSTFGQFPICYWATDTTQQCQVSFCDSITIRANGTFSRSPNSNFVVQAQPPVISYVTGSPATMTEEPSLRVFPSPTHGVVNIELTGAVSGERQLSILDVMGRPIRQRTLQARTALNTLQVDVSDLPAGVYIVRLDDGQTASFVKR